MLHAGDDLRTIVAPPLSTARYKYFYDLPASTYVSSMRDEAPLVFRCGRIRLLISGAAALDPPEDGDVVYGQPALAHHLLKISVA